MLNKCQNCGAPLDSIVCEFCGYRNMIDLKFRYEVHKDTDRICPNCEIYLNNVIIDKNEELYIDICRHCKGIFLDFGKIEAIMEREIVKSEKRDFKTISQIINHPLSKEKDIKYKKCPNCSNMMSRVNYKQKSGVIMDRCKDCGYWLDAGELRQMMEWAKLEGIRDFTPTMPKVVETKPTKTTTNYLYSSMAKKDYSFLIDSFMRKIYGF